MIDFIMYHLPGLIYCIPLALIVTWGYLRLDTYKSKMKGK